MMSPRLRILVVVGVPVLVFTAFLIVGTLDSDRQDGRPGVNSELGEVAVTTAADADFLVTTLEGNVLRLSDLKGSIVMVDFWSSWCPPCRAEAPVLSAAYDRWSELGVEFVGISIWDQEDDVRRFIDVHGLDYPNAIDDSNVAVDFGVKGIPEKFFVNREGVVVRKVNGPNTSQSLDMVLTELSDEALGIDGN